MLVARTRQELASALQALPREGRRPALVPTMGALHDGHVALVDAAGRDGCDVVASIFVNPLQFDNASDLARYPADQAADLGKLEAAGCALAWLPDPAAMYRPAHATFVEVAGPSEGFEGAARPGHFRGVATVVAMLFGQVRPGTAWFGEKDWQQLQVIRRMTADLLLPVEIRALPTQRDADGLALSSRNRFLDARERAAAPLLYRALREAAAELAGGAGTSGVLSAAAARLSAAGFSVDYLALVDGESLAVIDRIGAGARLLAAAKLGSVRLLDNIAAC